MSNRIALSDIRKHWTEARVGLMQIKSKCPNVKWLPEDVYAACVYGHADFYWCEAGFVVLQKQQDPFEDEPHLLIWCMWANNSEQDAIHSHLHEVIGIAHKLGFKKIRGLSPRPGFAKFPDSGFGKEYGWKILNVVYELEVPQ